VLQRYAKQGISDNNSGTHTLTESTINANIVNQEHDKAKVNNNIQMLRSVIQKLINKGFSKESIKKLLLKKGWKKEDVDEAMK